MGILPSSLTVNTLIVDIDHNTLENKKHKLRQSDKAVNVNSLKPSPRKRAGLRSKDALIEKTYVIDRTSAHTQEVFKGVTGNSKDASIKICKLLNRM